ncbi:3-deoxy-D-manno-octulosonic acid transferase [uncultured Vibrio sp.]|uniref:3-deoxy-D-manno-octulosonic acid transferase n=1 Tax=uncultured Vibrio sp. TaxID=114054 RepID=UPI002AA8CC22|nr:3-deoxy-D-manno-octulosonic acid transferase [uncultured Vibrio sp.]
MTLYPQHVFMAIFQFLYVVLSSLLMLCTLPLLPLIAGKRKYRSRILQRLGVGLHLRLKEAGQQSSTQPTIWIHALSVGEVTSALPLVRGLRQQRPEACILFTATTRSGAEVAEILLAPLVDAIIPAPLDLGPVVPYFLHVIQPDLFIQVETDFWPHWLFCLQSRKIPMLLVNGRISSHSFRRYRNAALLFRPMFAAFTLLAMQTENDAHKMNQLGLEASRVLTLGNLKFDTQQDGLSSTAPTDMEALRRDYGFSPDQPLWICGSTHPGEEAVLLDIYATLRTRFPGLQLLLAPRNIDRTREIVDLLEHLRLPCRRRTRAQHTPGPVLILDTIGELAGCYAMADIAFIGGSLHPFGGHNPLEPAGVGIPVLVGPHTEDFSEITRGLVDAGGVFQAENQQQLMQYLARLLDAPSECRAMGARAASWMDAHRGVVGNHLKVIDRLLAIKQPVT